MLPLPHDLQLARNTRPAALKNAPATNRARKAARIARALHSDDARNLTDTQWDDAITRAGVNTASPATRAAVTALLDVQHDRLTLSVIGPAEVQIAYNSLRKAARLCSILEEVGLWTEDTTAEQWGIACQIIGAKDVSTVIKDTVHVLACEWDRGTVSHLTLVK